MKLLTFKEIKNGLYDSEKSDWIKHICYFLDVIMLFSSVSFIFKNADTITIKEIGIIFPSTILLILIVNLIAFYFAVCVAYVGDVKDE